MAELRPRRRKRTRGGGGSVRGLTAEPASARARSGMPGSSRIAGEDPRRPESNLATATAPRGTPACVARRGGSWRRGGAPGTTGRRGGGGGYGHGVRQRRQRFGRGERERCRGGRGTRERGRDPGRCWALLARPGRRGGGHAGSCRGAHARGVRRPRALSLWREEGDDWRWLVSWADTEPGQQVAQVSPGKGFPPFCLFSIFLTFVLI